MAFFVAALAWNQKQVASREGQPRLVNAASMFIVVVLVYMLCFHQCPLQM
jgi:hypothetical protein